MYCNKIVIKAWIKYCVFANDQNNLKFHGKCCPETISENHEMGQLLSHTKLPVMMYSGPQATGHG